MKSFKKGCGTYAKNELKWRPEGKLYFKLQSTTNVLISNCNGGETVKMLLGMPDIGWNCYAKMNFITNCKMASAGDNF